MSRDVNGNYTLAASSISYGEKPANSSKMNSVLSDIATALTDSLSRSGKGAMQANLAMGGNSITGVNGITATGAISCQDLTVTGTLTATLNIGNIDAASITSGTLALARLSNIADAQISAAAAIGWTKISKTGSSLADLTTRSATDLTSGTLPDARFPATLPALNGSALTALNAAQLTTGLIPLARLSNITNAEISATAAVAWTKIDKTGASLADLTTRSAGDLSSGTLPSARLTGSYTGITAVGTLTSLALSGAITGATTIAASSTITATGLIYGRGGGAGLGQITVSTAAPSGGAAGDLWFKY